MADTGNTSTIAFGTTSGFTPDVTIIGGLEQSREALEDTLLSTTGEKTYIPDDLIEPGQLTCTYYYNQSETAFAPIGAAAETITITFPLKSGEGTAATLAGTGFLVNHKSADLQNGELMMGEFTVQFDGKTGPTFTAGSV